MKVLVLSHFYAPEPCAAANRVGALAAALTTAGHRVTVVTGMPSFPEGVVQPAYRGRRSLRETLDGVTVQRVWTYASERLVAGNRLANWLSVALGTTAHVVRERDVDLIVVSSPPITLALPALVATLVHRVPLVVDIRDVFPEVAIAMGRWRRDSPIARAAGFVADALYRAATRVVTVTPAARDEIAARGVPRARLILAPNGFDAVEPAATIPLNLPADAFVVAYVGNMGLATGLDVVLDAAALVRDDPRIRFVLVGDGADAARLRARVASEGLAEHVSFAGVLARTQALRVIADAGASVVPLVATIRDSLPTKIFDAMAVGTPVVLSAAGEARRIIEESGGGLAADPGDAAALAARIRELAADPERARALGAAGRRYVQAKYDRRKIMDELVRAIVTARDQAGAPLEGATPVAGSATAPASSER